MKRTPFVTDINRRLFVDVRAVMSMMVALIDLSEFSRFDGDDRLFMPIEDAIAWSGRECEENPAWKDDNGIQILEALKRAKHNHEIGERNLAAPIC